MRERNVWKILAWLIREELKEFNLKEFVIGAIAFLVSAAIWLLIFRR